MKFNTYVYQDLYYGDHSGHSSTSAAAKQAQGVRGPQGQSGPLRTSDLDFKIKSLTDENTVLLKENQNLKKQLERFVTKKKKYI